jgi:ubiquinone/menaquinone biosynthesis C-methylase UbiE
MEWPPLVQIYETRFWRLSPVIAALAQISFEQEYQLIKTAANLENASKVLDLACGPGLYARRLARDLGAGLVFGLDVSLPMLRRASELTQIESLKNLILIHANALELPFEADEFDVINCGGALHLFPDPQHVLSEVHRVLKPGGRFTLAALRHGANPLGEHFSAARRLFYGINSFTQHDLDARLRQAGFSESDCLHAAGFWMIMSTRKSSE